jgi:two-component system, chemotaxis family, chemotaxis protein CheY
MIVREQMERFMKKILVVDDSAFTRATLRKMLENAGHEVHEASSGLEALELMPALQPDLVTVDLLMPEMKGDELLTHMRQISQQCPVVVITADIQTNTRGNLLKAGAAGFITKPVKEPELLETVTRLLLAPDQ